MHRREQGLQPEFLSSNRGQERRVKKSMTEEAPGRSEQSLNQIVLILLVSKRTLTRDVLLIIPPA